MNSLSKQATKTKINKEYRIWTVYMHTNKINNKVYVGLTRQKPEKRWKNKGSGYTKDHQRVFYRAIQKYGWDNFEHIIFAEKLTHQEALDMERLLIALYKTNCNRYQNPSFGYNMTDGGEGGLGRVASEKTHKRMSEAQQIRCSRPEEKERRSKTLKEMKSDPAFYNKMIESVRQSSLGEKNYWYGKPRYGEDNPNYGNKWSEEQRQRLSEYSKNRSEEHRKHLSEAMKLRFSDPTNHPMFGKGKPVVQLTKDGQCISLYASSADAHRKTGISISHIRECCKGIYKTTGGYQWKEVYDIVLTDNETIPGAITLGIVTEEQVKEILTTQND